MYKEAMRAAWAEINLTNLDFNIKQIKNKVGRDVKITGIIKADGYGHGSVKCASVLKANGIDSFGVATLSEAIKLRKAGYTEEQILILGLTPEPYADILAEYDLTPVICGYTNAEAVNNAARKAGKIIECYVAVDTGMGRIGYNPEDPASVEDVKMITTLQHIKLVGLFSHFATADAADKNYAHMQENRYSGFYKALMKEDIVLPMKALSNSAAIMEIPTAHFNQVRPCIILYGVYPSEGQHHCYNSSRLRGRISSSVLVQGRGNRQRSNGSDYRQHLHGPVHDRRNERSVCTRRRRGDDNG